MELPQHNIAPHFQRMLSHIAGASEQIRGGRPYYYSAWGGILSIPSSTQSDHKNLKFPHGHMVNRTPSPTARGKDGLLTFEPRWGKVSTGKPHSLHASPGAKTYLGQVPGYLLNSELTWLMWSLPPHCFRPGAGPDCSKNMKKTRNLPHTCWQGCTRCQKGSEVGRW